MIIYLWDAPPRCGVSGSLEKAQEAAGTTLIAGHAPSARVESARLAVSAALEPAYDRTGQVWQARSAKDGVITWEPGDTGLAPQPEPRFAERAVQGQAKARSPHMSRGAGTGNNGKLQATVGRSATARTTVRRPTGCSATRAPAMRWMPVSARSGGPA